MDIWEIQCRTEVLGEEHPDHLRTKSWLAKTLDGQGKTKDASVMLSGLIEEMQAHFDEDHFWLKKLGAYILQRDEFDSSN